MQNCSGYVQVMWFSETIIIMKIGIYCFETWEYSTVVFLFDCGIVPHFFERN